MEKGVKISDVNNILYHKNVRGKEKIPISSGQNIPQVITAEELRNYIKEDIEGSGEENIIEKITFNGQEATINEATKTAEIRYTPPSEKDPTVPSHVKSITLQDINNWNLKQDNITDLDEIRNNALLGKDAYQKPSTGIPKSDLSQEVQNLLDNPSITAETDPIYSQSPASIITYDDIGHWNSKSDFTGNYNDLYNKPTIPSALIQSDWNQTNTNAKDYIKNKPTIPLGVVVDNALSSTSENPVQNKVINSALDNKVDSANLATVATSGSYNDLSNKPIIPIVPTNVSDFTNDAGYVTSSDIPTKTSELTNDSGFITGADIPEGAAASSTTPLMDGTASAGTSNAFARGDHRHPTDTTRQATITGGASTITSTDLTKNRALISNDSGKVAVSDVTSTELGYLDGVTSNILTQLNNKANKPSGTITAGHVATLDTNGNLVDSGFLSTNIGKEYKIDNSGSTPVIRDSSNNIVNSYNAITADDWLVDTSNNVIYRCFGIETNKLYFRGIGHDGEHVGGYEINTSNNELALLPDPEYLQSGYLKTVNGNSLEGTGDIKIGGKTYYVTYSSGTFTVYDSDNNLITDTSVLQEEDVLVYRYNNSEYYYYCSEVSSNTKTYITDTVPPPSGLAGISSYQGELAGLSYDASILQVLYNNKTLKYYNSSGSTGNIVTAATIVADGLNIDSTPTAGSNNPVTSAGIKAYVDNATPTITMDDTPTSGSNNPVKSSGIYNVLQGKQNTLTFDSIPTASSSNPVTSGGVKTALDLKANQSTTYTKTEVDGLFDDVAYLSDDDGQATTLPFDPQADTVWNKAQTLGSAQLAQARNNIGAVGSVTVNGTTYTPTNGNVDLGTISGGGGSVTVDSALSTSSTNPVQNSVITTALNGKVGSSTITSIVSLTEAAYTALATKDASTLYVIVES